MIVHTDVFSHCFSSAVSCQTFQAFRSQATNLLLLCLVKGDGISVEQGNGGRNSCSLLRTACVMTSDVLFKKALRHWVWS